MLLLKCLSGLSLTREFDSTQHSTQFDSMTGPIELNSRSASVAKVCVLWLPLLPIPQWHTAKKRYNVLNVLNVNSAMISKINLLCYIFYI
jgi:hypothetical protein